MTSVTTVEQSKDFELDVILEDNVKVIDDDDKESQVMVMDSIQITSNPDDQISQVVIEISADKQTELEVEEASVVPLLIFPDTLLNPEIKIQLDETGPTPDANSNDPEMILDDKATNEEVKDMINGQRDAIITSFLESSSEVIEAEVPPLNFFLLNVPRFEDENLIEQIQEAQLQLDEKIKYRKAIGAEVLLKKAILKAHYEAFKTANSEVIAAMKLVKSKSPEIQYIQSLIDIYKIKNVLEDEEIDNKKHTADDIIEARNQKKEIIERLENLEMEMDSLKENVSKAEAAELAIMKTHDEENEKAIELKAQFEAADKDCQQAFKYLNSLKKRLYDKNKYYFMYKKVATAARNLASAGEKSALDLLCVNQVERFKEEWNRNSEFRKEYTSRIRPSSPDQTSCVSNISKKDVTNSVPIMESVSVVSTVEQGKKTDLSPDETSCVSGIRNKDVTNSVPIMESVSVVLTVEQGKRTDSSPDKTSCVSDTSKKDVTNSVPIVESVSVVLTVEQGKKTDSSPDKTSCVSDISKKDVTNSVPIMESVSVVSTLEQGKKTDSSPDYQTDEPLCVSDMRKRDAAVLESITETVEQGKGMVLSLDNQAMEIVVHKTNHKMKISEAIEFLVRDSKFVSLDEIMEDKEKEKIVVDLDRKGDELTEEEIECKLKEQIRLEEKRRMKRERLKAEKAQKRAQLEAQKEAELKEKTREKPSRKKKRKRIGGSNTSSSCSSSIGMNSENNEKPSEANDENNEKPSEANETNKSYQKPSVMSSMIGKRRPFHQWWKMVNTAVRLLYHF